MDYELIRSNRKTLALQITEEQQILVRAPKYVSRGQIDAFVLKHREWINRQVEAQKKRQQRYPPVGEEEAEQLKRQAKVILPSKVAYYGGIMGVEPTSVRITSAKTRFGSCSGKNGICFSWLLMRYPEEAIDYVVVHELAHIRQKNHSAAFYQEIERVLPDYRERKKILQY